MKIKRRKLSCEFLPITLGTVQAINAQIAVETRDIVSKIIETVSNDAVNVQTFFSNCNNA